MVIFKIQSYNARSDLKNKIPRFSGFGSLWGRRPGVTSGPLVIVWVRGGLPTGGQQSHVYVLCAEHKEHKQFLPGTRAVTRPGGSVTGRLANYLCAKCLCAPARKSMLGPLQPRFSKTPGIPITNISNKTFGLHPTWL